MENKSKKDFYKLACRMLIEYIFTNILFLIFGILFIIFTKEAGLSSYDEPVNTFAVLLIVLYSAFIGYVIFCFYFYFYRKFNN